MASCYKTFSWAPQTPISTPSTSLPPPSSLPNQPIHQASTIPNSNEVNRQHAAPVVSFPSARGRGLNDYEVLLLFNTANELRREYNGGAKGFWKKVERQFTRKVGRSYVWSSCRNKIASCIRDRKVYLLEHKTGRANDDYTSLQMAVDDWIAFIETYSTDNVTKEEKKKQQERKDRLALDYRDALVAAMKNQSRKRHQQFNEIETDDTDTAFATPASTRSKKKRNTDFTKDLLERLVATAEQDSHTFEHALGGNSSIKALCSRIDEMNKQVSVLKRLIMEIMERLPAQAANSPEDL